MSYYLTLIISDGEVGIDVLFRDHGEIEVMSLHRVIWIHSTEQLNYLQETRTDDFQNMRNTMQTAYLEVRCVANVTITQQLATLRM